MMVMLCVCGCVSVCAFFCLFVSVPQRFAAHVEEAFSYQELGQHILCTARGCSRAHRLEQKNSTHSHQISFL